MTVYGFGAIGPSALFAIQGFYLLYFYTDVVRYPAAVVTVGLAIGRVWDLVNDPLVGWLSDRSRNRFGRRRGFVLAGAIPLAITTALAFSIPAGLDGLAALGWMVVSYALWDAAITVVHVPYFALGVELFDGYDRRTSIVGYGAVGALLGYALGGVAVPLIAHADVVSGYRRVGVVFGVVASVTVAAAATALASPRGESHPVGLRQSMKSVVERSEFRRFLVVQGLVRIGLTLASATLVFFVIGWLGEDGGSASVFIVALLVGSGASIPVWRWLASAWDKVPAYVLGLSMTAVALGAVWLVPPGGTTLAIFVVAVIGFGNGAHWVLPWSLLADLADEADADVAAHFGVYGAVEKATRSLGLVAAAGLLALGGHAPDVAHPTTAGGTIRLLAGPIPALLLATAAFVARRIPVTRPIDEQVSPARSD